MNLKEKVLETISQEQIDPTPAWQFRLIGAVWGLLVALAAIVGSLAVAIILLMVVNQDWAEIFRADPNGWNIIIRSAPYWWLMIMILLVWVSYYEFKRIGRGYRQPMIKVVTIVLGCNLVLGGVFYLVGWAECANDWLGARLPLYDRHLDNSVVIWNRPEQGFLIGRVDSLAGSDFYLIDPINRVWLVETDGNTIWLTGVKPLSAGNKLRVIGQIKPASRFKAAEVLPGGRPRRQMMRFRAAPAGEKEGILLERINLQKAAFKSL